MKCPGKHTTVQIPVDDFNCPKCGAVCGDFAVYETGESAGYDNCDCDMIHEDDYLYCAKCEYDVSGKQYVAAYIKAKNMVPCPHCNGKGYVKK